MKAEKRFQFTGRVHIQDWCYCARGVDVLLKCIFTKRRKQEEKNKIKTMVPDTFAGLTTKFN